MYNLDVGEHYYSPMTKYLDAERGTRGETPGALTYDERLAKQWLYGRRYEATELRDRYARASSLARGESAVAAASNSYLEKEMAARSARASSEMRATATSQAASKQQLLASSMASTQRTASTQKTEASVQSIQEKKLASSVQQKKVSMASQRSEVQQSASASSAAASKRVTTESKKRIEDDICKKVADIRMSPWSKGQELDEANAASARARARIIELERELEEITRKAMTTQVRALKTAKQMAAEATREDEAAMKSSITKTKKVMVESSAKIV